MAGLIFTRLWADGWWDKGIGDRAAVYLWAACFKARMFLVNPMLIPKADIQMLIWEFTCKFGLSTLLQTQHYPKSHSSVSCKKEVKTPTKYLFTQTASLSVAYFLSLVARPWKKKKEESRREEGHSLLLDFWSVFIGLGSVVLRVQASSCFSSFVLSKVCPMHCCFVWRGRRHITFCLLSQAGGWGDCGVGCTTEGAQKANL